MRNEEAAQQKPSSPDGKRGPMVQRLAKVLFETTVQQTKNKFTELPKIATDFETFFRSLHRESDRALSVVSMTYIESILVELFSLSLVGEANNEISSLFDPTGPLSTLSSRLKMGRALGWIRRKTFFNIDLARRIRNEFAHKHTLIDFGDRKIQSLVNAIEPLELTPLNSIDQNLELSTRQKYFCRCAMFTADLIIDLWTAPVAIRHGVPPSAVASGGWDKIPDPLRTIYKSASGVLIEYLSEEIPSFATAIKQMTTATEGI